MINQHRHTPGPWELDRQSVIGGEVFRVHKSETRFVATINAIGNAYSENLANAQLIAAAPELLEALKETFQTLTNIVGNADYPKAKEWAELIAKAEGKE